MLDYEKNIVGRIALVSDPHYSTDSKESEEKWFPWFCTLLRKINPSGRLVKKFLDFWDRKTQEAFENVIGRVKKLQPYDLLVGLGDYTPGANESGMLTQKTRKQYAIFKKVLDKINCLKKLIWGDHDAGYRFNVKKRIGVKIGTEAGGVSVESVKAATQLIGDPFGCFWVDKIKFIFISTNLVRNVGSASPEELKDLKIKQETFLAKTLYESHEKVFVLLHDPTALHKETAVRKILDSHQQKILAIIHGHMHAGFVQKLNMLAPVYFGLCLEYKTILVPASWGFMGIGGGFAIMKIYDDGTYEIKKYKRKMK